MDTEFLCLGASFLSDITVNEPTLSAIVAIVCASVLLFASGFASGSEIAFFSLSPADMNAIEEGKTAAD